MLKNLDAWGRSKLLLVIKKMPVCLNVPLNLKCLVFCFPIERNNSETFKQAKLRQESEILKLCHSLNIQWIFLAGYMRILTAHFLKSFHDKELNACRVINIHPSLLPEFPGKDGYGDAFHSGAQVSGISIHFVDEGVDTGPIILQGKFERQLNDTLEDFKKRGLQLEHQLYPQVLDNVLNGKIYSLKIKA
jgi:phosphoribosylglycinamide formyltransferase-1